MIIKFEIGNELAYVRGELETQMERAIAEVASGSRPEYAAGFYAATVALSESIEMRYLQHIQGPRAVQDA